MPELTARAMRSWAMGAYVLLVYIVGVIAGVCAWNKTIVEALEKWQTLIGAFAALIAAFIGALFIHRQIRAAWKIEEEKRRRKVLAARAVMPIALSALIDYCLACGKELETLFWNKYNAEQECDTSCDDSEEEAATAAAPALPKKSSFSKLPPELIPLLKEYIEHAPDTQTVAFRTIIRELQVLGANLRDEEEMRKALSPNMLSFAARAAVLHARAEKLFPYARKECGNATVPPTIIDAEKALIFFGFDRDQDETKSAFQLVPKHLRGLSTSPPQL